MTAGKKQILLQGNCQGEWLCGQLRKVAAIDAAYEITYLPNFGEIPESHPGRNPQFLSSCSHVLWQTAPGIKAPEFLNALAPDCRQIRFPTLWLKLLWPLNASDPRNRPETGFPYGRYPYGDRLVMKLMNEGVQPEDIPKRYVDTDLNSIVNLDRFAEISLRELRFNDLQSDISITPLIEGSFREKKLFGTVNHPTIFILHQILTSLKGALVERSSADEPPLPTNAQAILGTEEVPLHPQIVRHFGITWATPETKWRYHCASLSLEEYLLAYARFTPIPFKMPASILLDNAQKAYLKRDIPQAERILLEATALHPEVPVFLQYLAIIYIRERRLVDAERVLRYALSMHPQNANLHTELGSVMLKQNTPEQAILNFEGALKINPDHKEALAQRERTKNLVGPLKPRIAVVQ